MMFNKGLKVILSMVIAVSLLTPFNIHADTTTNTAPFIGVNIQVTGYGENQTSITYPALNINEISSNQSEARMTGQLNCTSPSTPTSSAPCDVFSFADRNGNSSANYGAIIDLNLQNYLLKFNGNATVNGINYFFVDYEFILDDNYKGYVVATDENNVSKTIYVNGNNFHYQRMQDDLTQHSFTISDYSLIRVIDPIVWNFPIESLPFIYQFKSLEWEGINEYEYYSYPIINLPSNFTFRGKWGTDSDNWAQTMIIGIDKNVYNQSTFESYFSLSNGNIDSVEEIYRNDYLNAFSIFKVKWHQVNTGNTTFTSKSAFKIIPIYLNYNYNKYISTDFALTYGLSNRMLDDINLLANGNTASSSAVSNNESTNQQLETSSNQLFSQEDSFKSDMNNAMQNIPQFSVNNFGSKFMSSATWVRQQYERMTNNTPFQQVITFSLLVGLSMILIGKVRK